MKTGFELLKTKSLTERSSIDLLEQTYKLILPPIFRLFASYFELGQFYTVKYFVTKYSDYYYLIGNKYEPNEIVDCTGLFQIEKVFEYHTNLQGYCDEDIAKNLIRIAEIGIGGGIFIGTKGNELDKVIMSVWDREPQYEILANNIFEFMQNMVSVLVPEAELIESKYSQLYKNYGEDFWRVREENI